MRSLMVPLKMAPSLNYFTLINIKGYPVKDHLIAISGDQVFYLDDGFSFHYLQYLNITAKIESDSIIRNMPVTTAEVVA